MRILTIALILLALACSKKETSEQAQTGTIESPSPAEGSPPTSNPATAAAAPIEMPPALLQGGTPPADAPPVIAVLDQGSEPRQAVRWKLERGYEQKVQMRVGFTVNAVVMTLALGDPRYDVTFDLTLRVKKVDRDGTVRVAVSVDDATIHPAELATKRGERLKKALSLVREATGSYTMDPRGHIQDVQIEVRSKEPSRSGHDMADNLAWALVQMTAAFPEEPIGQGAKWTVHRSVNQGGMLVNQLTTLELLKREGSRLVLKTETRQNADKQPFTSPGTFEEMTLLTLQGEGAGNATWELTQLAPDAAEIEANVLKGVSQEVGGVEKKKVQTALGATRNLLIKQD